MLRLFEREKKWAVRKASGTEIINPHEDLYSLCRKKKTKIKKDEI